MIIAELPTPGLRSTLIPVSRLPITSVNDTIKPRLDIVEMAQTCKSAEETETNSGVDFWTRDENDNQFSSEVNTFPFSQDSFDDEIKVSANNR